jgi:hypothetical protein
VLFYGEQQKFPQIGANPLFMRLAIPFTGTKFLSQHESLMLLFDINHNTRPSQQSTRHMGLGC